MAENRNLVATALLVLSTTAYNVISGPPATPGVTASGAANPTSTSHKNDLAPWDTYARFADARLAEYSERGVRFLIATLPDPVDTHLAIDFDRGIESVQSAASAAGYSFDRYWIPWRENTYAPTADPGIREKQENERRARESQPGLMLFRGPDKAADLVVLLVGETPTAGINLDQFASAVTLIAGTNKQVSIRYQHVDGGKIPLTGPNFSGSFPSLKAAIHNFPLKFRVASGSTTNEKLQVEFKKEFEFSSTIHPDERVGCAFLDWVARQSGKLMDLTENDPEERIKVAVLSEGDTAFGQGFSRQPKCETSRVTSRVTLLNFPFPRDIARLRNAYHEDSFAAPVPDKYRFLAPEGVPLTLKDPNTGHDSVPSFSHEHTPISQDATLLDLAGALRRNEVRYAGIAATDPLDTFFLAQFLAANTPDVRLFEFDGDLMFVRPPDGLALAGMLSVTTYPMFVQNQQWTNPLRALRIFPSRYSQGVYNATLSLLLEQTKSEHALVEYASPFSPGDPNPMPPLWLMTAGRNGYWPVELLSSERPPVMLGSDPIKDKARQNLKGHSIEPSVGEPPHLLTAAVWIATGLLVWSVIGLFYAREKWSWSSEFRAPVPDLKSKSVFQRANLILVCVLCVSGVALCLMGPQWKLTRIRKEWEEVLPVALFVPALAGAVLFLVKPLLKAGSRNKTLTCLCAAGFGAFVWWGIYLLRADDHHQGFFLAYRCVFMSSGVAPNIPLVLILLALFVWGRVHLQRRILIEERCQPLPAIRIRKDGATCELCTGPAEEVKNALDAVCPNLLQCLGVFLLGVAVFSIGLEHLQTLEPPLYAWFYVSAVSLLFFLVLLTTLQLLRVWTNMERVLDVLETHPIRFALSDLPQDRSWSPIWQSNVRKRSHVLLTRGVECLQALRQRPPQLFGDPKWLNEIKTLEKETANVLSQVALGNNESEEQSRATTLSDTIAGQITSELEEQYWRLGSAESPSLKLPDSSDARADKWDRLKSEFVALRVLAYIRYVMLHLRNLLGFMTTGFVLALLSLESYPFQASHVIMSLTTALFAAIAGAAVWMFYRMSRNMTLRRITSSNEGKDKSDWSYLMQLAETGALPVLALVAANFPGAGRFLFSWLGPVLDKLH